jgi:hypothetical protein
LALLIVLTVLREAPLVVIVSDHKRAADHFMNLANADGKGVPSMFGPPVEDEKSGDEDMADAPKSSSKAKKAPVPIRVFAVVTNTSNPQFTYFSESARKAKVHVEILGEGDTSMSERPLTPEQKLDPKNRKAFSERVNFGRKLLYLHQAILEFRIKSANLIVWLFFSILGMRVITK